MNDKMIRLAKAFWRETVKRIPYILIVLMLLIFIQLLNNTEIAQKNSTDTKNLLGRVAALSQDNKNLSEQNHELSQQNISLSNQNSQHIDCLARLFAQYTQTLKPIKNIDLQACIIVQGASQTSAINAPSVTRPSSQGQSVVLPSTNSSPQSTTAQSKNPPVTNRSLLQDVLNPINHLINGL